MSAARTPPMFWLLFLLLSSSALASDRDAVESAVRRVWKRPELLLAAGLRQPPGESRARVVKALEFTVKSLRLDSVQWSPSPTASGQVAGDLQVTVSGRMPPSTATLDCTVALRGTSFDRGALERRASLEIVSPGKVEARVRMPLDLLSFLNRGTRFSASEGKLEVRGKGKVLLFDVPFRLVGRLESEDRVHVDLEPDALSLARIPAPGPVRDAIVDSVNPVFCADAAMGPLLHLAVVEVDRVRVEPTGILFEASGRLRLPGDPELGAPHHLPKPKSQKTERH